MVVLSALHPEMVVQMASVIKLCTMYHCYLDTIICTKLYCSVNDG